MIIIVLGNLGSGKTACTVREMAKNPETLYYSNILCKLDNQRNISSDMIIKRTIVDTKINRKTGDEMPIYEEKLNIEFWKNINEPISVVLDEAHTIMNSRSSMTKQNKIVLEWMSLLRRILGQGKFHDGELILITQLPNRIDTVARDMCTQVRYHLCYYTKKCSNCGYAITEHSDMPEKLKRCLSCNSVKLVKSNYRILIKYFRNMADFEQWFYLSKKSYYKQHMINDIENYFPLYNTLQWDSLFS